MPLDQPVVLKDNQTCCYCRNDLNAATSDMEHVVARNFVPKNTLHQSWNLIARACKACNNRKSDLEDDLAVLTLQHYRSNGSDPERDRKVADALAKATRTVSRLTRKPVSESATRTKVDVPFGGGYSMSLGFRSPPHVDEDRAYDLAMMQASAFFYWMTYDSSTRRGQLWPGGAFLTVDLKPRSDWGNPVQLWFMRSFVDWQIGLMASIAHGFFKVAIRRHQTQTIWSCAFEWNEGMRIVALFGDEKGVRSTCAEMPPLSKPTDFFATLPGTARIRRGTPLCDEDDLMFVWDE